MIRIGKLYAHFTNSSLKIKNTASLIKKTVSFGVHYFNENCLTVS